MSCDVERVGKNHNYKMRSISPAGRPTSDVVPGDGGGPSYEGSGWLGVESCCQVNLRAGPAEGKERLARVARFPAGAPPEAAGIGR